VEAEVMHRAPRLFFVAALRFDRFGKPPFDTRAIGLLGASNTCRHPGFAGTENSGRARAAWRRVFTDGPSRSKCAPRKQWTFTL